MSVGVGFLLFYLETGRAIIARYGNLSRALAWPLLFRGSQDDVPPPTVVASAAVIVFNGIGIVIGAAVLVISLINLYAPSPGHFHFYLLLGEMAMAFGFMAWLTRAKTPEGLFGAGYWGFLAYLIGGTGLAVMFLIGGAMSVPRHWAVHLPQWFMQDRVSAVFALISIIGALVLLGRYLTRFALTARA